MSIYLMQRPFAVHELLPLFFKRFSTTMHYSKMSQMTVTFIDIFQILKIIRENPVLQYNFHRSGRNIVVMLWTGTSYSRIRNLSSRGKI